MPVATSSSGRALYDHASAAFVHNMPLEALSTVHNAIQTGQARATPLLAEQFCVLRITALCAIYTPCKPAAALEARLQQWRQQSGAGRGANGSEAQWSRALTEQLSLAPPLFFSRLWWQTLQFYHGVPTLPSIAASSSDLAGRGLAEAITPTPDVLQAALQLPGAVLEALVLGALKIDEDLARNGTTKKAKPSVKEAPPPGLQAARAMCEWALSAYSTPAATSILSDHDHDDDASDAATQTTCGRQHLHDQYGRVLRLYALEVLGVRLQEWEYGGEIVRCAKLITGDADEVHARTALLAELAEAHSQADTRDDRRQAAKDKARRILQEQVEKRKMQASTGGDLTASTSSLNEAKARSTAAAAEQAQSASPASPANQTNGQVAATNGVVNGKRARPALPERASSSSSSANSGGPVASRRKASSSTAATPSSSGAGHVMPPAWSLASIRTALQAWLRKLGGGPAVLLTLIAVALTVRRALGSVVSRRDVTTAIKQPAQSRVVRAQQLQGQTSGLISTAWQKVLATVRMGTQVTYL